MFKPEGIEFFNNWFKKSVGNEMYPYQISLLQKHSSLNIINKSRQTGITTLLAVYGLFQAMKGNSVLIISPSYRQSAHVMEILNKFLTNIKHQPLLEEMKTSIRFEGGGEIRSLPNSASTVRGYSAKYIIADEMAHFLNGTDAEVLEAISPSLSRGGELWLVSTPYGEQGIFWQYWTERADYIKHLINWKECPDLQENTIRQLCPDPLTFAQEYDNQFLGDVETEFPWAVLKACVNPELQYENPLSANNVLMGVDVGRHIDQTAIIGVVRQGNKYNTIFKQVLRGTEFSTQQHLIEHLINTKKLVRLTIDETGIGAMMAENIKNRYGTLIRKLTFTPELKEGLVTNMKRLFVNKLIGLPDDPQLLNAFHAIKRIYSPSGHLRFDSGRDDTIGHSDVAWALMLALYEVEKQPATFRVL